MKVYKMNEPPKKYQNIHTSKGNQLKWYQGGYWYKADQFGYERIAESVVSHFLEISNIPFPYVKYEVVRVQWKENPFDGCRSRDFFKTFPKLEGYELIPIEKLHRQYTGIGLADHLTGVREVRDRVNYTIDFVTNITGLEDFYDYLSFLIQIDAFFLNEDRHTNNIAVLWNPITDKFELCPYFDFGLSLFSDIKEDFPIGLDFAECRKKIKAKPFSLDFDEQLDVCELIGKTQLHFEIKRTQIRKEMELFLKDMEVEDEIKNRVIDIVSYQGNKYQYVMD